MLTWRSGLVATRFAQAPLTGWTSAAVAASKCSTLQGIASVAATALAVATVSALAIAVAIVLVAAIAPEHEIGPVADKPRAVIAVQERALVQSRRDQLIARVL